MFQVLPCRREAYTDKHRVGEDCMCVSDETEAITRRRVRRPKLPGSLKSIRLREYVFNLWTNEALGFSECTDSEFAV